MTPPIVDRLMHEPISLAILLAVKDRSYTFMDLLRMIGEPKHNLSAQLHKLGANGLLDAASEGQTTRITITEAGLLALIAWSSTMRHWRQL